jgi:hypothetical protein
MNTPNPQHDSALVVIGGFVAEVDPVNLPAGTAAICTDMDFNVGSVFSRDGISSVYVYEGADEENNAGLGVNIAVPNASAWLSPDNIIHDTVGTYASVILNFTPGGGPAGIDGETTGTGSNSAVITTPSLTPTVSGDLAFFAGLAISGISHVTGTGVWAGATGLDVFSEGTIYFLPLTSAAPISGSGTTSANFDYTSSLILISPAVIGTPASVVAPGGQGSEPSITSNTAVFNTGSPITTGNGVLFYLASANGTTNLAQPTLTDNAGNVYTKIADVFQNGAFGGIRQCVFWCGDVVGNASVVFTAHNLTDFNSFVFTFFFQVTGQGTPAATLGFSDILQASTYTFTIPASSQILGVELQVSGKQTLASTVLTATPIGGGTASTFSLPLADGTISVGGPGQFFGLTLTPAIVNTGGFGFDITAADASGNASTVDISGVQIIVWYTPPDVENFNWVKSFEMENGSVLTLAIDNTGVLWQEDAINDSGVLTPIYTELEPNSFAQSTTYDDREWIAISNNQEATDMPRQYNGQWVDRVSQVGPGAPPAVTSTATTYAIVSITQAPAVTLGATPNSVILWSAGPSTNSAGNVITIFYSRQHLFPVDPLVLVGGGVVLAGIPTEKGLDPNGNYIVSSIGSATPPGGDFVRWYFTVQAQTTGSNNWGGEGGSTGTYEMTLATLTTSTPIPNVQVGSQIAISGGTVASWDATWTILYTPNAAQLQITSTSLSGNTATYDFTLITGTTPVIGQQVTVTGTDNGDGVFNVVDAIITATAPGSFSVTLNNPNVSPAAEPDGQAIVNGTIFQFDPGLNFVGGVTNPIFGNSTGGTLVQPGNLGAGTRLAVVFFKTRNDLLTPCSNPVTFTLTEGANSLVCSNLPIGPPNVIARIVAFTGAGGDFFYWIPDPVTVTSNGQKITYTPTIVNDNTSSEATFTFTDAVLLQSVEIDVQGNDLFEQIELGSCLGFITYGNRLFAIGEQNKIQNLINLSFDGGFLAVTVGTAAQPLGWTIDPVFGANGQLENSPLFGNAFYIQNATGSTIAGATGMIWQSAFQDFNQVAIINTNTQYGVRVTASCPGGISSAGALNVDLFSPSFNRVYGIFTIPLSSMSATMQIFTGNLLLSEFFSAVPSDLQYRVYATGLLNLGDVMIDRTEPFDLSQPVLTTQFRASYQGNFEAFDDDTGNLGWAIQNQQEVRNAFELYDNLYAVRTRSMASTADNGITEPDGWTVREVSNKVGTPSIHGVDVGEGWAVIVGEAGVYVFDGGQPTKFSPELDPLWAMVQWAFGYTLWVRNDTNARRLSIGLPIPTPNQWMPKFPANANPTQPNVILVCQYKELMSSSALAGEGPVRQAYQGTLKSYQLGRKWSAWSIEAAYADFITRDDTTQPLFYCGDTDTAKIYQQLTGNHLDDGEGMFDQYVTYPFLKSDEAQQIQAGLHQLVAEFASSLVIGSGNLTVTVYPDTLESPYTVRLDPPFTLGNPSPFGDTEMPCNVAGTRFFVGFETLTPGDWFQLSRVVLNVIMDPWAPTRGSN